MDHLADQLDQVADTLSTVDRWTRSLAIDPAAVAADEGGLPGRLGRELLRHWDAVCDARAGEAGRLATRLAEAADAVRTTGRDYQETDAAVARRLGREA